METNKRRYLLIDYETRSRAHLSTKGGGKIGVGAHEYAVHESTEILCVAWKLGTRAELKRGIVPTWLWNLKLNPNDPQQEALAEALRDPSILIVAENAGFERAITEYVLSRYISIIPYIPIRRWICTASLGATHALPRSLEGKCEVLKLPVQKNKEGKLLIKAHCVPQRITKNQPNEWNDDPIGLARLGDYCAQDVAAMTGVFLTLPPLIPFEREVWKLNQRINTRGVYVDRHLVKAALELIAQESARLNAHALTLTGGVRPTQRDALLKCLKRWGCNLPNLQKKTVEDAVSTGLATGRAAEVLGIRQSISKTSTAKYLAFEARSRSDSRLRDLQLYHGASTGRESGMGVQPHNLPRWGLNHTGYSMEDAVEVIRGADLDWVRAMLGDAMTALSSCLKGVVRARPGNVIYCGDFSQIEVRVLFWIAGHEKGLALFTNDEDPYRDQATAIYNKKLDDITSEEREVGKRAVLGCGFGMGFVKFQMTCEAFGTPVSDIIAQAAVKAYRTKHHPVPALWNNLERAAKAAVDHPGKVYRVNRTKWFTEGRFLYCELPSGRRLAYCDPTVERVSKFNHDALVFHFWSVDPKTHQWAKQDCWGGTLTENVVQAIARDFMVTAQLNTERAGYIPMFSVHDECPSEREEGTGSIEEFERIMTTPPEWAPGFPLRVKAWCGTRYKK